MDVAGHPERCRFRARFGDCLDLVIDVEKDDHGEWQSAVSSILEVKQAS